MLNVKITENRKSYGIIHLLRLQNGMLVASWAIDQIIYILHLAVILKIQPSGRMNAHHHLNCSWIYHCLDNTWILKNTAEIITLEANQTNITTIVSYNCLLVISCQLLIFFFKKRCVLYYAKHKRQIASSVINMCVIQTNTMLKYCLSCHYLEKKQSCC